VARAGKIGIIRLAGPDHFGSSGEVDYPYRYVVTEEIARAGATPFGSGLGSVVLFSPKPDAVVEKVVDIPPNPGTVTCIEG
jgi:hypothetical protein